MIAYNSKPFGIGWFAREILHKPLYWYQELIGDAILASIRGGHGRTFTVMLARQMGKNQLSAVLEAYLLCMWEQGTIVKAAPTYKPQVINSKQRLLHMLDTPGLRSRVWKAEGYMIGMSPAGRSPEELYGARALFFSAGPESHIVGATASLLLEIDEAQDVLPEKFDTDLKPMASTTDATTVLYGTAWSDRTLLAQMSAHNQALEQQDGIRRHFAYDWTTLAQINPRYRRFVEGEMARLGEDHVSIRTQYRLLPISGSGYLLNDLQRLLIKGSHNWLDEPDEDEDGYYIAGMDIGGEDEHSQSGMVGSGAALEPQSGTTMSLRSGTSPDPTIPRPASTTAVRAQHDSTVISIGRVSYNELDLPTIEIVHQYQFNGMKHVDQYAATCEIMQRWHIQKLVIDKTGLGEGLASLLMEKFGEERVHGFRFTRPSKSALTFHFLSLINSGRLKLYSAEQAPRSIYEECWHQLTMARYSVPGEGLINMFCTTEDNTHDDFLISMALCTETVRAFDRPVEQALIIKPRRFYNDGRF
ncbi:MAG TPA: hypothetical protein VFA10_05100 [Ktedonobacteraceae bacterium]|nr:hypothetical protein [Ktedonobacteraceae bacterium]